jgi:cell wall-associated NlpC family hydrolase
MVATGLGLIATLALAWGCTPITTKQRRAWEEGRVLRPDPATDSTVTAIASSAALLADPEERAVQAALALLGTPRSQLDCSEFTARVWRESGIALPRTVREQWVTGVPVDIEALRPGDLVFFAFSHPPVDHVAIYVGQDRVVHVSSAQGCVALASIVSEPFANVCVGARRPRPEPGPAGD